MIISIYKNNVFCRNATKKRDQIYHFSSTIMKSVTYQDFSTNGKKYIFYIGDMVEGDISSKIGLVEAKIPSCNFRVLCEVVFHL